MRWLLIKDLQILRRSPLLVAVLVIYPVVIALLIGFALSRGPDKPRVAFANLVPEAAETISVGGDTIDLSKYSSKLFDSIDPVRVDSREKAIAMVRDGDVLGALILPPDVTTKLSSGLEPARVEVVYNNQDPVKGRLVEQIINSRLADANAALAEKFREAAVGEIGLLLEGGEIELFGHTLEILGLQAAERILGEVLRSLPPDAPERAGLERIRRFASLAVTNLNLADDVLTTVSQPVQVTRTALAGATTPLDSFAVAVAVAISLMFVAVLLASGMLALEREEGAFTRLVRGLVSRTGLLTEKIGLAAVCAWGVTLAMVCGLALFVGLDWSRFALWIAALAAGALAFAAMGVAIGALAREVRAASLLAFLLTLPIAFLALVPDGSVSEGVLTVVEVVSALFPFRPTLQALDAAFNGGDGGAGIALPVVHLLGLTAGFGVLGRMALQRFG